MRRLAIILLASLVLGALTFFTVRKLYSHGQQGAHQPFTAFVLEKYYDGSGALVKSYNTIYAVRSNGSWAHIWPSWQYASGPKGELKGIWDFGTKKRVGIDSILQSITTWPLSDQQVAAFSVPDTSCRTEPNAQPTTLLGYEVVKVRRQLGGRAPWEGELWFAPALNCFALREVLPAEHPTTERQVLYIIPGEPSPTLFETPTNYTERSPSQAAAEFTRRFGKKVMSDDQLKIRDQIYLQHQKHR